MGFQEHKGCVLRLPVWFLLLGAAVPDALHSVLLKLCQGKYIAVVFQRDSRVFVKQVKLEIVRPNCWTRPQVIAIWADNWVICTRWFFGTVCCNFDGELHKVGAQACLHVDREVAYLSLHLFQNDLAKWRRPKAQPVTAPSIYQAFMQLSTT